MGMKRCLLILGLGWNFAMALSAWADGLIVIRDPVTVPVGHYAFAPLEVRQHHVNVRIRDQVAVTSVDQTFYNPNNQRLEGTYIFPVPAGAQINKFTMEINGKPVEAELLAADKARAIYEEIVRKIRDPALLEYAGRDIFKVRIFPIEPLSEKRITLSYTQLLPSDGGLVRYLYPLNTEKFSASPIKSVSIKVDLDSGEPIGPIYSPSHTVEVRRSGPRAATIGFETTDSRPDTDFELIFGPADKDIGLNLLTHQTGDDKGYFAMLVTPNVEIREQDVVPKDVIFVLDTSGSMAGDKLQQARKALDFCVENLNDSDRFEVVRFSTDVEPLFDGLVKADDANRRKAFDFIKKLKPIGGTAIDDALRKALALRKDSSNRPFIVIFLTDGQPTVGETQEETIVGSVKKAAGQTRIFCFGVGADVNTHLLDKITETTRAASQYVLPNENLEVKLSSFFNKIKSPVLSNPKLTVENSRGEAARGEVRVSSIYPEPLPDLFKGEQFVVVGRYEGQGPATITLEGTANGKKQTFRYKTDFSKENPDQEFIARLWSARRIGYLLDEIRLHGENRELRDEVTDLARQFGIVTPYTSYLIVEDERRRDVPMASRTMQRLENAPTAREESASAWGAFKEKKSGIEAVAGAASSYELKRSENLAESAANTKDAADRMLASPASPYNRAIEQVRYVKGRAFFQNANQWLDSNIQRMPRARRVQVAFGSGEYYDLLSKHPNAKDWLSVGRNVQFVLGETIYEIVD